MGAQYAALPDGLRALQYLGAKGGIIEVDGLMDITVQTMAGKSFGVVLESGSSARLVC